MSIQDRQIAAVEDRPRAAQDVVVCDPHRTYAEALGQLLRSEGLRTELTSTPRQALDAVARSAPRVCLVELRFAEGPHAGLKLVAALRQTAPGTGVVVVSATAGGTLVRAALQAGARAVLSKSTPLEVLLDTVRRLAAAQELPRQVGDRKDRFVRAPLTRRQEQVLTLLSHGSTTTEVGRALDVSTHTAREHVQGILRKLDVHSRLEAALTVEGVPPEPDVG